MIIDFHSHILPGVDHGCKSSEESKKQLEVVSGSGVDMIVATSHFYPHVHKVDEFLYAVNIAKDKVAGFSEHYGDTKICLGAEVLACEMMENMEGLDRLCIRGTRCLLLEMPSSGSWSRTLMQSVENIMDDGYTVILAHIDRYVKRFSDGIDALIEKGAKTQINADSLGSFFERKKLMPYIEGGCVYALGSDFHGSDKKTYKVFTDAKKNIGAENYERVMRKAEKLLADAEIINSK